MANRGRVHDPDLNRNRGNINHIMMRVQKKVNHQKIKRRIRKSLLVELQVLNNSIRASLKQEVVVSLRQVDVKKINLGLRLQNKFYLLN